MFQELLFPLLVLLFLVFAIAGPILLYRGLKRLADPVSPALPLLISILVFVLYGWIQASGFLKDAGVVAGTLAVFTLMFFLVTLAIVTAYSFFSRPVSDRDPWLVFALLAFIGNCIFFLTTMGHVRVGMSLPLLGSRMPGSGDLIDLAITALNAGDIVYAFDSLVYSSALAFALYLNIFVLSAGYFWVLSILPAPASGQKK